MNRITDIICAAQEELHQKLDKLLAGAGLTRECYTRYLSMQYHLTKGVQSHFYRIAGHQDLVHRKALRSFLVKFADEEAPHFAVAEKDLKHLGTEPFLVPLDVELWRAYFASVIEHRPFVRLGATCILENIAGRAAERVNRLVQQSDFLEPRNMMFLTIHMHGEELPHGEQIIEALRAVHLDAREDEDLVHGAEMGKLQFLRMLDWAFMNL